MNTKSEYLLLKTRSLGESELASPDMVMPNPNCSVDPTVTLTQRYMKNIREAFSAETDIMKLGKHDHQEPIFAKTLGDTFKKPEPFIILPIGKEDPQIAYAQYQNGGLLANWFRRCRSKAGMLAVLGGESEYHGDRMVCHNLPEGWERLAIDEMRSWAK